MPLEPKPWRPAPWSAAILIALSLTVGAGPQSLIHSQSPTQSYVAAPQAISVPHVADQILVQFKESASSAERHTLLQTLGLKSEGQIALAGNHLVNANEGDMASTIRALNAHELVEYAEPDYIYSAYRVEQAPTSASLIPDDEQYDLQWGLEQIRAPEAWAISTGSDEVVIAIVDTGVELNHSDLAAKIVTGNTFVRRTSSANDDSGHGTHVASVAAGQSNNQTGVAGVSWHARIMPVKVLNRFGFGRTSDIANGIEWAVNNGADIINLSLGGSEPSNRLRQAVEYADDHGVLVIAAVGNEYQSGSPISYPAAYDTVLAVGASDRNDRHADEFSSSGSYLDVVAPGEDIQGAFLNDTYESYTGTSMASPSVAGLAALLLAVDPDFTTTELMSLIRDTAFDLESSGWDELTGYGRIDAAAALSAAQTMSAPPPETEVPGTGSDPVALYLPFVMQ